MSKQLIMSISFKQDDKWIMEAVEKGAAGKNKSKYVKELLELGLKLQSNQNSIQNSDPNSIQNTL